MTIKNDAQEYATALRYIRALLQVEPGNRQAQVICIKNVLVFLYQELENLVTKRMEHEGLVGMAVTGLIRL